jgi:hypothetical protein
MRDRSEGETIRLAADLAKRAIADLARAAADQTVEIPLWSNWVSQT